MPQPSLTPDPTRRLQQALGAASPVESLRALTTLRSELAEFERLQIARALEAGSTFADLARILGISRQAAHRRYRTLAEPGQVAPLELEPAPPRPVATITREARAAIAFARDEAVRRGMTTIDSGHLLLGLIATVDQATARRLRRLGVTVEAGRRLEPSARARTISSAQAGRATFEPSLRGALMAGGSLGVARLFAAALNAPDGGARRLLERLDVEPEVLEAASRPISPPALTLP